MGYYSNDPYWKRRRNKQGDLPIGCLALPFLPILLIFRMLFGGKKKKK